MNTTASASNSVAIGNAAVATGNAAYALGVSSLASGDGANAFGGNSNAIGNNSNAMGSGAVATGGASVALGTGAKAVSDYSVVVGVNSTADGGQAVAIGAGNTAYGNGAVSIGDPSYASGTGAFTGGANNVANSDGTLTATATNMATGAVAIGNNNKAIGQGSVALGNGSTASAAGALAFGNAATATNAGDVALGSGSVTATATGVGYGTASAAPASVVSVGGRRIQNLSAGSAATDAVNVSQLSTTANSLAATVNGSFNAAGVYTGPTYTTAAGTTATTVQGALTNQTTALTKLGTGAALAIGGGAAYDPTTGALTAGFLVNGTLFADVASAISGAAQNGGVIQRALLPNQIVATAVGGTGLLPGAAQTLSNLADGALTATSSDAVNGSQLFTTNANVTQNTTDIATNTTNIATNTADISTLNTQINNGSVGLVQQAGGVSTGNITVAAATGGTVVDFTGTDGARTLTGVSDGIVAAGSLEAVNGSQLFTTNANVTTNTANIATNTANIAAASTALSGLGNSTAAQLGGGATYDATTGVVSGGGYKAGVTGATYTNVADALANITSGGAGSDTTAIHYDDATNATITLGGAAGTTIKNVAAGALSTTSTDAVNGSQLNATNQQVANNTANISTLQTSVAAGTTGPVQRTATGLTLTAAGGTPTAPGAAQTLANVANGLLSATSSEAVTGAQLFATNQAVAAMASNGTQYDNAAHTSITYNAGGAAVGLHNIAAGIAPTDAVNVGQLNSGIAGAIATSNAYTDSKVNALSFDLQNFRKDANAGTSTALAAAGLPQAFEPGKSMISGGFGTYRGQAAWAFGLSRIFEDGHTIVKAGVTRDTRGSTGANAGIGYQF